MNAPTIVSFIFPNASLMVDHSLFTAFLNVSDLLYKSTNPATNAATAMTTSAIGFIDITTFNADCAIVIDFVATAPATLAVLCATIAAVLTVAFAACVANPAADFPKFTTNVPALFPALNAFVPNVLTTVAAFPPKSRIVLYPSTTFFTPLVSFPNTVVAGPTAATTAPILRTF